MQRLLRWLIACTLWGPMNAALVDDILKLGDVTDAWATFQPRPDKPERYDQQQAFYESKAPGVAFLIGGNGSGTTSCAMAKIAKFILSDQRPPRRDTPFWIIGNTYDQICKAAWKEKLSAETGHGHIPLSEVQWHRIAWYRESQALPYTVPLKPWPDDPSRNWMLVFKSYEQGRGSMMAESIGGFCFVEQFPWGLLEEVLRGCREYNFPGSKLCEFTPVDPNLSIEIEEMQAGLRTTPAGWEFFRANTECAMEAGHVSRDWFEEFFGLVPDEMRATRMTGAYATYEGQVYQTFNPAVHLFAGEVEFPPGVWFRRAIDWGAGPENAFCCLWAYRDGLGRYTVFDEYYSTDQSLTTIDHLCEVADKWPWPANNPYFGTTWADPSSPDDIRIAAKLHAYTDGRYTGLPISPAANAVIEGIQHVQWLLKPTVRRVNVETGDVVMVPRLRIHRGNCPYLSRQMRTYRWLKSNERGLNPKDARREPLKKEDHSVDALRYLTFSEASVAGMTPDSVRREDRGRVHGVHLQKRT